MIKTGGQETTDLVVPINESFMVMFLNGRLERENVSGLANCFCQSDFKQQRQLILVVPPPDASRVPGVNDLRRAFLRLSPGKRRDSKDLLLPYQDLMQLNGAYVENVMLEDREMIILYASRKPIDSVRFADSTLVGIQLRADEVDETLWPKNPEDYYIIGHEAFRRIGVHNLLLLVRSGAEVIFSPSTSISAEVAGHGFMVWDHQPQAAEKH